MNGSGDFVEAQHHAAEPGPPIGGTKLRTHGPDTGLPSKQHHFLEPAGLDDQYVGIKK